MEDMLLQIGGAVVGVLGALTAYIKIASDRKKSGAVRDRTEERLNERVAKLETRVDGLDEIKEDVKGMRTSFDRLLGFLQAKFGADGFKQ